MSDILLSVKNLVTSFSTDSGKVAAVKGISFDIKKGETLGIVGESGSGKSVTSLSIMQLLASNGFIESGKISFLGKHKNVENLVGLDNISLRELRGNHIGMVFQESMSALNPVMRCGEQVAEAIRLHLKEDRSTAKESVLKLFEKVELPDPERIYAAYPHELSGGQMQRVMIAMAISCNPELLIADEPTTALDVTVQKSILKLISDLQLQTNSAVLFITHDLGVVAEVADRVAVMYQGKIVEEGPVEKIFRSPQHHYTKSLLACRPPLNRKVKRLPTVSDFLKGKGNFVEKVWNSTSLKERRAVLSEREDLLKVKDLNVRFAGKKNWFGKPLSYIQAVKNVSFTLKKGETLGLVGESGSGKTTLSRAILRLAPIRSGKVIFEGENILEFGTEQLRKWRKGFQIIFQDPASALNPRMTIGRAILEPMTVHGIYNSSEERVKQVFLLLEKVGLKREHFDRYPHEFSGGQKQRICIARALALKPKFIICDESVSALDVSVQAQVLNLLLDLQEEFELTYIFISHDLSVVQMMSDRILVMNNGEIVEQGYPEDVYNNPKEKYTQQLINAIPRGIV